MKTNINSFSFKKITVKQIVFFFLLFVISFDSYSQDRWNEEIFDANTINTSINQLLVGHWKLNFEETIFNMNPEGCKLWEKMEPKRREYVSRSFSQRQIIFETNGNYELVVNSTDRLLGNWELQKDKELLVVMDNGLEKHQRIHMVNASKLVLYLGEADMPGRLFDHWYLTKISQ